MTQTQAEIAVNAAAALDPGSDPQRELDGEHDLYPNIIIDGARVFAYASGGGLVVAVDLDEALSGDSPVWATYGPEGERCIPVRVSVGAKDVFRASPAGETIWFHADEYPEMSKAQQLGRARVRLRFFRDVLGKPCSPRDAFRHVAAEYEAAGQEGWQVAFAITLAGTRWHVTASAMDPLLAMSDSDSRESWAECAWNAALYMGPLRDAVEAALRDVTRDLGEEASEVSADET